MNIAIVFEDGARVCISWQHGDDHRAERLFRVAHFLHRNKALPSTLIRLHDHAGILRPCWSEQPTDLSMLRLFHEAWSNECESQVWHMLGDNPRDIPFLEDGGKPLIVASPKYKRPPELAK